MAKKRKPRVNSSIKVDKYSKIKSDIVHLMFQSYNNNIKEYEKIKKYYFNKTLEQNDYCNESEFMRDRVFSQTTNIILMIESFLKNGRIDFYIKDESLFEFLSNMDVKSVDIPIDIVRKHANIKDCVYYTDVDVSKSEMPSFDDVYIIDGECQSINGVIHCKEIKESIMFCLTITTTVENGIENIEQGITIFHNDNIIHEYLSHFQDKKRHKWMIEGINDRDESMTAFRFVFNFINYIFAFNDFVLDGAPEDAIKEYNKNQITVRSSKMVEKIHNEFSQHYKSPHLRRGHFRHLSSDYYKNKKGKITYISPCFIKGRAKTVIEA
jgi:hypothetical protein